MMSIPTTSNCSKRHFSSNFNLINNNHNNNNNKYSPEKSTTLTTKIIKSNSTSCGSSVSSSSSSNCTISRIPILIRLPSPGPYRRSPISQRLRNSRRSSSLTNSPIPKSRKAYTNTSIPTTETTNHIKYEQQLKYTSLKMNNINTCISPTPSTNEQNVIMKKGFKDINNIVVVDNISISPTTLISKKKDSIAMTTEIMDKNKIISTNNDEVDHHQNKQLNLIENNIKSLKLNEIGNGESSKYCDGYNKMRCYTTSSINGPISPISEEGIGNIDINTKRDTNGMSLDLNGPTTKPKTDINSIINGTKARTPKSPYTPRTPITPSGGHSTSKLTPKTPPVTPDSYNTYFDDDLDSLYSYSSGRSTMSCDHPYVARNGTTFSGRKMKYVVHCSSHAGQVGQDYLTPTQRAQRQLRRLKELLIQARQDLEQKDSELCRLTREVVELRLFKASLSSPEDRSNSSDAVTVREALTDLKTSQDVSPIVDMIHDGTKSSPRHILHNHHQQAQFLDKITNSDMASSFADSGHFEDMTSSASQHSSSHNNHISGGNSNGASSSSTYDEQRCELIQLYEKKIEELIKTQDAATNDMKRTHNDRVEALLQKLAECNTRYADIVPDYEQAKERIRELEKQMDDLEHKLLEHEDKQKKMYLHMYNKEQEAEQIAQADKVMELAHRSPVSVPELLKQLQTTQDELENIRVSNSRERGDCALLTAKEAISLWVLGARKTIYRRLIDAQQNKTKVDPEVTLQFLKSAIYYFLTDKENSQGHLKAIESILEFTEQEKININKARASK